MFASILSHANPCWISLRKVRKAAVSGTTLHEYVAFKLARGLLALLIQTWSPKLCLKVRFQGVPVVVVGDLAMHHVTITELIVAPNLHFGSPVWLLGNIPIPITVVFKVPLLKGHLPVRAVLLCPHLSSLHLMDSVHL